MWVPSPPFELLSSPHPAFDEGESPSKKGRALHPENATPPTVGNSAKRHACRMNVGLLRGRLESL